MDKHPWPDDGTLPRNAKVFPHQLKHRFGEPTLDPVFEAYPDVALVEIFREDTAAIVASIMYSEASNIWNTQDPDRIEKYRSTTVKWDRDEAMSKLDHYWCLRYKARKLVEPHNHLTFEYEEIAKNPTFVSDQILAWIGVDYDPGFKYNLDAATKRLEHPAKSKLADQIREWRRELDQ